MYSRHFSLLLGASGLRGQSDGDARTNSSVIFDEGDVGVQGGAPSELPDALQQEWRHLSAGQATAGRL